MKTEKKILKFIIFLFIIFLIFYLFGIYKKNEIIKNYKKNKKYLYLTDQKNKKENNLYFGKDIETLNTYLKSDLTVDRYCLLMDNEICKKNNKNKNLFLIEYFNTYDGIIIDYKNKLNIKNKKEIFYKIENNLIERGFTKKLYFFLDNNLQNYLFIYLSKKSVFYLEKKWI